ncbi:MAG: hypothetical protein J6W96_04025 [Alphaproteobacteria bacterium]|nr:hypothetical protein [Alphaproteobacteria bacterium]
MRLGFDPYKVFIFNKNAFLPLVVIGSFLVYFFSVSDFSEETYHSVHLFFMLTSLITLIAAIFFKIPSLVLSISVIYISYLIINNTRYTYGEDYMFSSGYNIWSMLILPNLLAIYFIFSKKKFHKYWSIFYVFLFMETALIEKLLNQSIDADSYFFYKHLGMFNYPALGISILCLLILIIKQITKGQILNASMLFSSTAVFIGIYFSDDLFAFSLFFWSAAVITLVSTLYYAYYVKYKDEELGISNMKSFYIESEKKYPLKYSVALMYIDEYERLIKRFGASKAVILKKMFLMRIHKAKPEVLIYNYKPDALILTFMNMSVNESFEQAEDIRRLLAKSIFIFNENNHLQLTVSQCISEKKRSDADALAVLERAEENLQKACQFTRNITIKA